MMRQKNQDEPDQKSKTNDKEEAEDVLMNDDGNQETKEEKQEIDDDPQTPKTKQKDKADRKAQQSLFSSFVSSF